MRINNIYIHDWLELKPYSKQVATDTYYLRLSNEVKNAIVNNKNKFILQVYLNENELNILSCFLTSYFEDIISETNIWNSFIKAHKRLYKKQLPFYILDEYYENDINPQDIIFLIWYFINTIQQEKFIAPYNDFLIEIGNTIFDIFDNSWAYAPENTYLKSFYQIDKDEKDFYVARKIIDTVLFNTYLFYPDTYLKLKEQQLEIIENSKDDEDLMMFMNENRDKNLHNIHTRLLSFKGKEWLSEIIDNKQLSKDYLEISHKIQGFFLYKGQDNDNIFIEHIASSKEFNLTKKSFDYSNTLKELDTILFLGIVKWKNEWWFSGVFFQHPYNPDLIIDEKQSLESLSSVNFLDHNKKETIDILKNQLSAFKNFNNGSQIAFLHSEQIEQFVNDYIEFYNKTLKLTKKEIKAIKQRTNENSFFGLNNQSQNFSDISETGLVFFNPKAGLEVAMAINSAFPLQSNPFFKKEESEEHLLRLLMDESLSTELVMFCIDNCKNKLLFFKHGVGKKYLEDIDFLLRFWKLDDYHTLPRITYNSKKIN